MSKAKEVYSSEKCATVTTYVSAKDKIKDPSITEKYYDLVQRLQDIPNRNLISC